MTPVSVTLDPTTGIAKRIAITSTASVENPSMKATIQGVGNRPGSVDWDVCTLTLLRFCGGSKDYRAMVGSRLRSSLSGRFWTYCVNFANPTITSLPDIRRHYERRARVELPGTQAKLPLLQNRPRYSRASFGRQKAPQEGGQAGGLLHVTEAS